MEKNKCLSIPVFFEKTGEIENADGRFTEVKIYLMHLDDNYNNTYFDKEVVDSALPSLAYIPIVGFIEKNSLGEDDFSDHRFKIIKTKNGKKEIYLGSAYGVIKSSAENNARYEQRMCDDGIERTFLVVDGILWNMFDKSIEIMQRDVIKSHSMELFDEDGAFDGYEDENGVFHFTKFSFRAACILGVDYNPAMEGSTVEMKFTMSDFVNNMQSELTKQITTYTTIKQSVKKSEGGKKMDNPVDTKYAQTVMEQFKDIGNIVRNFETNRDRWGDEVPRYYLQDIQETEAIVVDRKDGYNYYGVPFVVNGDKPELDFKNITRKKISYVDYVEGASVNEGAFNFGKHIAEIEDKAYSKVEEANSQVETLTTEKAEVTTEYENLKTEYEKIKPEYDTLYAAEEKRKADELLEEKKSVFSRFEHILGDNDEFKTLKDEVDNYTYDELNSKCSILYTEATLNNSKYSKGSQTSALEVPQTPSDDDSVYHSDRYIDIKLG